MVDPLLCNLEFTKSVGRRDNEHDTSFNDAIDYGHFPANQTIKGITQIDLFKDKKAGNDAFLTGLIVTYDGVAQPISHGLTNVDDLGTVTVDPETELLVGVFGQLKNHPNGKNDKRITSIGFLKLNKELGTVSIEGPFLASSQYLGSPWATFGPVIALEGTTKDGIGLTTLGFVKTVGGWIKPGFEII